MSEPAVVPPGGGEIIGDTPDRRVEVLAEHDALHVTWSRFGPGRDGADRHIHRAHTDLFHVLDGVLTIKLGTGGDEVEVPAGSLVRVPPFVVHGFRNAGDADVRYLNLHAPGLGFADYLRGLRDGSPVPFDQEPPPATGIRPASEAVVGGDADVDEISVTRRSLEPGRHELGWCFVLDGELELDGGLRAPAGAWAEPAGACTVSAPAEVVEVRAPGRSAG